MQATYLGHVVGQGQIKPVCARVKAIANFLHLLKAFEESRAMLQSALVLTTPDFSSMFKVAVDASDVTAGAVLLHEDNEGVEHPVCCFSKKFNKSERTTPPLKENVWHEYWQYNILKFMLVFQVCLLLFIVIITPLSLFIS